MRDTVQVHWVAGLLAVGMCMMAAASAPAAVPTMMRQLSITSPRATPVSLTPMQLATASEVQRATLTAQSTQLHGLMTPSATSRVGLSTVTVTPGRTTATPTHKRFTLTPAATMVTATPTRERLVPTSTATMTTATPTPERSTLTPTLVAPTATPAEVRPAATPEPSEPAEIPELPVATEMSDAAAEPTSEFVAPPGKALFVFYNYTGEDWNIDVGPHLLQVPATKLGEPYAVVSLELEPGTYTLMGSSPATGRQIHTMDGGLYIEFTVQAGDVYPSGVHY